MSQHKVKKREKLKKKVLALRICCVLALGFAAQPWGAAAAAEGKVNAGTDYDLETVVVEGRRPDWESKLSPGTVTIIRPDDYKGEQKTLPELLKDVPGVHVREINGKGQYTTVSVRGSTAAQVGVFVDGVLFTLGGDAAADISTIPVKNVERIEVYRGYIPARFGGTYMGGVINIVTKRPSQPNVAASIGQSSWGGYTGSLQVDAPLGRGSLMVGLNRDQSDGDFRYKNFTSDAAYAAFMPGLQGQLAGMMNGVNEYLGYMGVSTNFKTMDEAKAAFNNPAIYNQYVTTVQGNYYNYMGFSSKQEVLDLFGWTEQEYLASAKAELDGILPSVESNAAVLKTQMSNYSQDSTRWRRNNDYQNTDAIIKWQDDHWTAKATWKKIDRHLPWGLWSQGGYGGYNQAYDTGSYFLYNAPKRQELTSTELLLGRRDTAGNLEWGWSVNYLDQDKRYRNEGYGTYDIGSVAYWNQPLSVWSAYQSRRLGGAVDGSYKAGQRHMLEFLCNWSKEKMDVDGWKMHDYIDGDIDYKRRFRTYYEQTLFNLQLQDTITLNKAGDLWLTPSVRYNSSTVLGRSPYLQNDQHRWFNIEDEQTDSKATWQMALKKKVNDKLTLRSTFGTYYRLLNLYEIAGDGAGIIPRPVRDKTKKLISGFPLPEQGTQWDVSAIWDDKLLGAAANIELTYFGRNSKDILQLYRLGYDYWCYVNSVRGRVDGVELQTKLSWDKWDLNLSGTYLHAKVHETFNLWSDAGYSPEAIPLSYTPDWEGSLRLTYRPDQQTSVFAELKYVDEMFVSDGWDYKQTALTTVGLGIKHKFRQDFQVIVGVNDLFNKGPGQQLARSGLNYDGTPQTPQNWTPPLTYQLNTDCPTQGRTYYVTMQYKY